jgi:hypothetical protein
MKETFKVNIVPNKSKTYMLPYVHEQVKFKFFELLLNTYLSYDGEDELFCVLYEWSSDTDFLKYEGELMNNHLYVGHSDFGDKVVFKFRLSRYMKLGRDLFIQGRYEEFSDEHKGFIMDYLNEIGATNAGRISQILTKDMLLSSERPLMDNEILMKQVKKLEFKIETFKE